MTNKLWEKRGRYLTYLPAAAAYNCLIYNLGRFLARDSMHYNLSIQPDLQIPFLPWTVVAYWGFALFWGINYFICVEYDKERGRRFLAAHFIGETICFFFFVFFPTTMIRPEIAGNSIPEKILRLTYRYDVADNLFPSIHCFVSWLCWIGVRRMEQIPFWYKLLSLLLAVSICISTLTVKQHVVADVPAGIAVAEVSYYTAGRLKKICRRKLKQKDNDFLRRCMYNRKRSELR